MKPYIIPTLIALLLFFPACNAVHNSVDNTDTSENTVADSFDTAAVSEAFHRAHSVAMLFTGYASNVYTEGRIELDCGTDGQAAVYDRFAVCQTLDQLSALTGSVFTPVLANELLHTKAAGSCLLYIEQDGVLYRFGGYVGLHDGEPESAEVTSVEKNDDGTLNVSVEAVFLTHDGNGTVSVSHDYTCVMDGGTYKFTGDFPVLADLAIDKIYA